MLLQPKYKMRHKQRGMVIVVALFIVALVATLSYVMIERLTRDTQRTMLIIRNVEAQYLVEGSVAWAKDVLVNDWQKKLPNKIVDQMPQASPKMQENAYVVTSTLYDMQARYNINNIISKETMADFVRLQQAVLSKLPAKQAQDIAQAVFEWVTISSNTNQSAKYYLSLKPPYRPRHAPFFNVSELRLVKGVTPEIFAALQPYIAALPPTTTLNVQTVLPAAMVTLSNSMTLGAATVVENIRHQAPFVSVDAFMNVDVIKNHHIGKDKLTDVSDYFLVETKVSIEKQVTVIYTLLKRMVKDKQVIVNIVWQSKGSW